MLYKRKIVNNILDFMHDEEIIVIHGSRQVGKTSLMHYIIEQKLKDLAEERNIFYFDLEDFSLLDLCNSSVDEVIEYLRAKGADFSKKVYLFIDEIQYLLNPSSFLKLFHDRYKEKVKLIVSGSSSLMIKKKFKDSLVGRTVDFELFTLDFEEFLVFKNIHLGMNSHLPKVREELKNNFIEFVLMGGYPGIVLESSLEKKEIKLKQIISTYVKKDIRDLAEIRDIEKFNNLVKIAAAQTGNLVNIVELANTLGLAKQTVQEYLFLLENTYIIRKVAPFHKNIRSELSKMPKQYLEDTGLANILVNKTFSQVLDGNLLESSVFSQLRKNIPAENIYFWRTNKKQEIDFVIDYINEKKQKVLAAIEVKNIFLNKYVTNVRYFKKQYNQAEVYFCCLEQKEAPRDSYINVVYPWELLSKLNLKMEPGLSY